MYNHSRCFIHSEYIRMVYWVIFIHTHAYFLIFHYFILFIHLFIFWHIYHLHPLLYTVEIVNNRDLKSATSDTRQPSTTNRAEPVVHLTAWTRTLLPCPFPLFYMTLPLCFCRCCFIYFVKTSAVLAEIFHYGNYTPVYKRSLCLPRA